MLVEVRLHRIRALLSTFERLSTTRIAADLGVSRETIRRDLLDLESQGILRRVHGGVIASSALTPEPPLAVRQTVRAKEKRTIAKLALTQIESGQTVFIDAGTTTALVAQELASLAGLTVITNGLDIAMKISASEVNRPHAKTQNHVILLGGQVSAQLGATYGELTVQEIGRYRADVALLSPVGIHSQFGASSFEHHEAAVARAMVESARRRIILADNSKVGQTSRVAYASVEDVDLLITDSVGKNAQEIKALQAMGCEILHP